MNSLSDVNLFAGFEPDELRAFESAFTYQRVREDHVFFSSGEVNDSIFVVGSGQVQVLGMGIEGFVPITRLGPGRAFGELSFIDSSPATATVRAATDTEVLALSHSALDGLLAERPDLWGRLWRNLTLDLKARLVETNGLLEYYVDIHDLLTVNHRFREIYGQG